MKKLKIRLILLAFSIANVWTIFTMIYFATSALGLTQYTISFDYAGIIFSGIAYAVWLFSFKLMPQIDVTDAVLRYKFLSTVRPFRRFMMALWHQIWTAFLFLPLAIKYLVLGIKYRKTVIVGVSFVGNEWNSIVLKKSEFEEYENRGVSREDFEEHFIVVNNVCVIANEESASFLSLRYSNEQILKSFGYFGGLKDEDKTTMSYAIKSMFGYNTCPIIAKAIEKLGSGHSDVSTVANYVHLK